MSTLDRTIIIAGAAGQGLVTVGELLSKILTRAGYEVFATQYYMSRIRGGHNSFRIRISDTPKFAPADQCDLLFAFNQDAVAQFFEMLHDGGTIILSDKLDSMNKQCVSIPFDRLASNPLYENVIALGVLCSLLGLDSALPEQLLKERFASKGEAVVKENIAALKGAYEWSLDHTHKCSQLPSMHLHPERILINGNTSIALGAMAAGVRFCTFYPMTPGSSVAQTLINHSQEMGVVVEQVEDEIAALNMALGASYAGAPVIVPTSGGGFALMTEGVSLAGVMEQPIVIVVAQRPGPATGMPTRTAQGDLLFTMFGGHGEFPRIILAPSSVEECFEMGHRAISCAEKYQTPVIILTDQFLADGLQSLEAYDMHKLPKVCKPDYTDTHPDDYRRYNLTNSGISPRRLPGFGKSIVLVDSHAHNERGNITESKQLRNAMVEKMLLKESCIRKDVLPPRYYGADHPDRLLICWGSTVGAVRDAAEIMKERGEKVAVLSFSQVWPLEVEQFMPYLESAKERVCIEGNSNAQFAWLLKGLTCVPIQKIVSRYDGRPLTAGYIISNMYEE
ncbi:2-oxoacid:acceptor oxidoreductase subunit alpha [Halodesulfovibrio marinisediminis]|uniref:2-oxoglutarate ferredoxin oxidoreductase subunit alpha n=1 Tax=Halodesulfovibrio marinisediminis DSM 17456 TaxID=1121457 RepID=A0A1N6J824_9BACT|nr:2-oxoacid:acceptor oxidoreductase subunit alpha [Halodesulfovibrio marinisediminis]SIO40518.1 2-oxoglutarate ferredoxin oxidoreductase subunit alpha [Halodesulfovibrio marinisediminis DSM 17456]